MKSLKELLEGYRRAQTIKLLRTADPNKLEQYGEGLLVPAFRRAAALVPAYQKILKSAGVAPQEIRDVATFKKRVPVIDKHDTFSKFDIEELCVKGSLEPMKLAMASSGFSGVFSYGINTKRNYQDTERSIDTALDYTFGISKKRTFLVNCIPMGVKVTTSLRIAETSVRSDMALALIRKFSPKFDQTLIVSDPHFLKKLVEEGNEQKINWKKLNVSLIFGEDWFSESFRSYMAGLIELDLNNPDGRLIGATMGIAELDLNLFHESLQTILIRRKAQDDERLRKALFGDHVKAAPVLFHYYPHRIFLEALPENAAEKELVFSMLSPHMHIPLLRYNSRDRGDIIGYDKLKGILLEFYLGHLLPDLKLPLVWVGGRKERFMETAGKRVYPEEIKQGLYEDAYVASLTTGYFKLNAAKQMIEVQLKKGITITDDIKDRFRNALLKHLNIDLPVTLYPYADFPYGMELDYERKFQNI